MQVTAVVAVAAIASPASAHAFELAIVRSDAATSIEAQRGFRLAVDESPDESHPAGEDAGDHLGGVDVTVTEIASGPGTTGEVKAAQRRGAAAVVLLVDDPGVADAVAEVAAEQSVVAVVPWFGTSAGPRDAVVLRPRAAADRDPADYDRFVDTYTDVYGVPPTGSSVAGYDAGRLVDELVLRLGEHLRPGAELAAAA